MWEKIFGRFSSPDLPESPAADPHRAVLADLAAGPVEFDELDRRHRKDVIRTCQRSGWLYNRLENGRGMVRLTDAGLAYLGEYR